MSWRARRAACRDGPSDWAACKVRLTSSSTIFRNASTLVQNASTLRVTTIAMSPTSWRPTLGNSRKSPAFAERASGLGKSGAPGMARRPTRRAVGPPVYEATRMSPFRTSFRPSEGHWGRQWIGSRSDGVPWSMPEMSWNRMSGCCRFTRVCNSQSCRGRNRRAMRWRRAWTVCECWYGSWSWSSCEHCPWRGCDPLRGRGAPA